MTPGEAYRIGLGQLAGFYPGFVQPDRRPVDVLWQEDMDRIAGDMHRAMGKVTAQYDARRAKTG